MSDTTPRDDHSWAYALKPGDKACIRASYSWSIPYELVTFSRATATQFIFDEGARSEKRVNKSNLRIRGGSYRRVEQCTPEVLDTVRRHALISDLTNMKTAQLVHLDTDTLASIHNHIFPPKVTAA